MRKRNELAKGLIGIALALALTGCGGGGNSTSMENNVPNGAYDQGVSVEESIAQEEPSETKSLEVEKEVVAEVGYPKFEEIEYYFADSIRYEEPVAIFGYVNNSEYTIVRMDFSFVLKDGLTTEELAVFDEIKENHDMSDEDILDLSLQVCNYMVADSGESMDGATAYLNGWLDAEGTAQCNLFTLEYADIHYIAEDGKVHHTAYLAENGAQMLDDEFEEASSWSDSAYAQMVPKPNTRVLEVDHDKEDVFVCTAYDFSYEDFRGYIETCLESGFVETEDNKRSYYCKNPEGYQIYTRYFDYMRAMEVTFEYDED